MDEYRRRSRQDIVRVELVDGEVVHVGRAEDRAEGDDVHVGVLGGFEVVTEGQVAGGDPLVDAVVPERVVVRGVDHGGVSGFGLDSEVEEIVVVVDMGGGDGAWALVLAGDGVSRFDRVARLEVAYGFGLTAIHENGRVRTETARSREIREIRDEFICGRRNQKVAEQVTCDCG
jgi:hypothetical protein